MTNKNILIICVIFCIVISAYWGAVKRMHEHSQSMLLPTENATVTGMENAVASNVVLAGAEFKVLTIRSLNKILECDRNTPANALVASIKRREERLFIDLSSNKAGKRLTISDLNTLSINPSSRLTKNGLEPKYSSISDMSETGIEISTVPHFKKGTWILEGLSLYIKKDGASKFIELGDYMTSNSIIERDYKYCATIKEKYDPKTNAFLGAVSVILADLSSMKIAEIPLPNDLPRTHSLFALDPKSDCLLVFDMDLNWMIAVDLIDNRLARMHK